MFSQDVGFGLKAAETLEAGSVWGNNIKRSYSHVPFGGMKQIGISREKSHHALHEYLEYKTIYLGLD
ncbi:MAG: aldehyde dehydrogenase family protein [Chloroflexota bacterium]